MTEQNSELLQKVGARARKARVDLGLSIKAVAEAAEMSPRFISDVEAGRGNIAIGRLDRLARALKIPLVRLLQSDGARSSRHAIDSLLDGCTGAELARLLQLLEVVRGNRVPRVIALLGVRGSGKSTIGRALAEKLGLPFVELARRIEEKASMTLGDLFSLHGEGYYRRLEQECLVELVTSGEACVAALPGGIVTNADAFQLIRDACYSVWLHAEVEDYWKRVFAQGDTRPMAGRDDAMAELRSLVARREPLYRLADRIVETSGVPVETIVSSLADIEHRTSRRDR